MTKNTDMRTLGVVETQPATVEGLRSILNGAGGFTLHWSAGSLLLGLQLLRQEPVEILLLDKSLGMHAVLDVLAGMSSFPGPAFGVVVWGTSMSECEALKLLQAGARGILRKTADAATIVACLRTVARRAAWMEDCVFIEAGREERMARTDLTVRERQVLELVEQGMRNKEIAAELGIQPGTVKIHLKHIFEKTGVHGRFGLAISGFRRRGLPKTCQKATPEITAA